MSQVLVTLESLGQCRVEHLNSGAALATDTPQEYGGKGRSFSSTDLLAAALGSCVATSIDQIATRHGLSLDQLRVKVEKELSQEPKRVSSLRVVIEIDAELDKDLRTRIERAANGCPVKRSLHPDIAVEIELAQRLSLKENAT